MVFSTVAFLFRFLPIFLVVYYLVPDRLRNVTLVAGSFVFYAIGSGWYLLLLALSCTVNFMVGRFLQRYGRSPSGKALFVSGLLYDFAMLGVFKYAGFFVENINALLSLELPVPRLTLPLGISFYTFMAVSYLADVYTQKARGARTLLEFSTYLCMFPSLISGPISTFEEISPRLYKRKIGMRSLENGLETFAIGLCAKTILANPMGGLWNNLSVVGYDYISTPYAWLGAVAYSFQIYFDFAGYSIMAIGLGQMLGFALPQNFLLPYCSGSAGEFWRRWHMTLGRWFRNYIYIPLGGNRRGALKTVRNMLVVWAFTGLWHGASWNFVIWGLAFFVLLVLERFVYGCVLRKTVVLKHIYMILLIPLTWVIFAVSDLSQLGQYFGRLFPFLVSSGARQNFSDFANAWRDYWKILLPCVLFSTPIPALFYQKFRNTPFCKVLIIALAVYAVYSMAGQTDNPFLYFQF